MKKDKYKGRQVFVGGIPYKIIYFTITPPKRYYVVDKDDDEDIEGTDVTGFCTFDKRIIGLKRGMTEGEEDYTFFHELLHAVLEAVALEERYHKESFVRPFSKILLDTLRSAKFKL